MVWESLWPHSIESMHHGVQCALEGFTCIHICGDTSIKDCTTFYSSKYLFKIVQLFENDECLFWHIFRHIFAELCTKSSPIAQKLFASFISFVFIYLWHGYYMFLLIWVFLNLIALYLEIFGRHVARSSDYNRFLKPIGSENIKRLNAILGSQLLIPSIITNLMFLGGADVGRWLTVRTYFTSGLLNYAVLSFTAYNFYRASNFIFEQEKKSSEKQIRKNC